MIIVIVSSGTSALNSIMMHELVLDYGTCSFWCICIQIARYRYVYVAAIHSSKTCARDFREQAKPRKERMNQKSTTWELSTHLMVLLLCEIF